MEPGPRIYPPIKRDEIREAKPEPFVAGSLLWDWIDRADAREASLLRLAIHLYRMSCISRGAGFRVHVRATAHDLGISTRKLNRQLHKLHDTGLFDIRQKDGTWPTVYMRESPRIRAPIDQSKKRG